MATSKRNKGFKKIVGQKGKLHRELGVPAERPIPPGKRAAALAGKFGKEAKADAQRAFRGVLAKGRKTSARNRSRKKSRKASSTASRPRVAAPRVTSAAMNNMSSSQLYEMGESRMRKRRGG